MREFARVLKKGGLWIISTPNISAFRSRQRYLFSGFHNKGRKPMEEESPAPRHHINLLTFPELNNDIYRQMLSWPVCMGETVIIVARRI